jgi:error-prone DNA polymerase
MYVEMHAKSAFSFLEGASSPEQLVTACAELGLSGLAILDRDGISAAPALHFAARAAGVKPHVGAELSVRPPGSSEKEKTIRHPVLCESRTGYQNLCRLITQYKFREKKKGEGFTTLQEIATFTEGLICLTGGDDGPLAAALDRAGAEGARKEVESLVALFGRSNVYIELQRHFDRNEEEFRNRVALKIADALNLPLIATNGVCYAKPDQRQMADVFTCIRNGQRLETAGKLLSRNTQRYLRSAAEMKQFFADVPDAIDNTLELSARLQFTLDDLGYVFPSYSVPPGETEASYLRTLVFQGAYERYRHDPGLYERAKRKLEQELALIHKLGFDGFFLINKDVEQFCRKNGIYAQIRGSAAGSAVSFVLRFTDVDAISRDLLFERFLSEARGEYPDIDWDIESDAGREKLIQHVYEQYGRHSAAMTANVITYRRKSATGEVGKVLGIAEPLRERLSGLFSSWEWQSPNDTLESLFADAGLDLSHPVIKNYFYLCQQIQGLPRHLGQHSGGMIISQGKLDSIVPLEPATMENRTVCQWDKDAIAALRIPKCDFLGLGMLQAIKKTREMIRVHWGEEIDRARIPRNDALVYERLQAADCMGAFQVESRAQLQFLPRLFPKEFYDIVISVGSVRPGPIQGDMVNPLIKRRQGLEPVTYPHPSLEPILKRTYGVILFQEQALRVLMEVADFSAEEAEEARRAMTHKRSKDVMRPILQKAQTRMQKKGLGVEVIERILRVIDAFLGYAFPESHALAFGDLAYESMYYKTHYPAAFLCGLLNAWPMGFYHPRFLIDDAQRHGVEVKPIDIVYSDWECTVEKENAALVVRAGLRFIQSMRQPAAHAIVQARSEAPFRGIADLARRVPQLRKPELKNLATAGALNAIDPKNQMHRRSALWQVSKFVQHAGPLLAAIPDDNPDCPLPPMDTAEKLLADYHITGFTVGKHPLAYQRAELQRREVLPLREAKARAAGARVRIAGEIVARQRPGPAKGIIFMTLHDETGYCDAVVMPQVYERYRALIDHGGFLIIDGELQKVEHAREKGSYVISVRANEVQSLAANIPSQSRNFH